MELTPYQKNKRKKGICVHLGCSNKRAQEKSLCCKHLHQRRKELDPCGYTFHVLKQNAKKRGKTFTITLEYFRAWCQETNYIELKGRFSWMYSIDRKDHLKGYEPGNLQLLTVSQNSRKKYVEYFQRQGEVPEDYVPDYSEPIINEPKTEEIAPW